MAGPARRALRRARRGAWYVIAIGLVLMALVAGITSQLLPLVERHPARVAEWLGQRAGRPVSFDHLETAWTRRGPLLRLDGLRIGEGADAIPIGEAEVLVAQYAGLLPGRSFTELRLRGLELTLERADDGRWQVRGLPGEAQSDGDPFAALEGLGELQVAGGVLVVHAPGIGVQARLDEVDVRLRVDGERVRAAARAWMVPGASPLDIAAELDRDSGDARAWLALRRADLAAWSDLRVAGIAPVAGTGRVQAWVGLEGDRVSNVVVRGTLEGTHLQAVRQGGTVRDVDLGEVEVDARWSSIAGGWRLDAPRLRIGSGEGAQSLDGLLVAGGARRALVAERVDAGALLALAPLATGLPEGLSSWLAQAHPDGVLHAVQVVGDAGGALRASARIEGFGFAVVGDSPGMAGLAGHVSGDAYGLSFTPDPAVPVVIDWPAGFGPPAHEVRLRGEVVAWPEGAGWEVRAPALRIDGQGYGADIRGGLVFQGDGTRPVIDLAAELDEARVPTAKRFWVRHQMPEAAVEWLDSALVDGRVLDGSALASGDLDDWPFSGDDAGKGLFHASARLEDAEVRFDPGWPAATALDGRVDFIADGFTITGSARLGDVPVRSLKAGIAGFGDQPLRVDAEFASDARPVLALLRGSPLREGREEILDALQASGPLQASFGMVLPLGDDDDAAADAEGTSGDLQVRGRVALAGARLEDTSRELVFDDVHGEARYDHTGFRAEGLRVRREGQAGRLSLRAGERHVARAGMAFEAELDATLDASELATRAPELAWLGERLHGRSAWTVALALPEDIGADGAGGRLQLRSDLVGTRLALPEPLGKPAGEALQTRIDLRLPLGEDDVDVVIGGRMALRARASGGRTGVLAVLGSGQVDAAPPESGLRIVGRTPVLDAMEWAGLFSGAARGEGDGMTLRGVDLVADRLQLLGASFPATRVLARPERGSTRIELEGEALAGTLSIPDGGHGTLSARIERLYWRSGRDESTPSRDASSAPETTAEAAATGPDAATAATDDLDPAAIPPLAIVVEDLRLSDAPLGRLELHTQPRNDGLAIDSLQLRAPGQAIDVGGSWRGRGADARTRLQVDVDSQDFGALLAGVGQGGRLDGGVGEARFDASWSGSPAAFRIAALEGSLALTVKDGRLVEVEPGAGRVLGLLSVAELPRRLMLDFRDLFSRGFVFNRIDGRLLFEDGLARSEQLVIDGAAAEIHIGGSADLRAQTYDQVIEVQPRTGGLLTAVGAITGGPVGAAVGAVANAVFEKPLGRMGARSYHVTGPWKDPKVVVERRDPPGDAPAPESPPADAPEP